MGFVDQFKLQVTCSADFSAGLVGINYTGELDNDAVGALRPDVRFARAIFVHAVAHLHDGLFERQFFHPLNFIGFECQADFTILVGQVEIPELVSDQPPRFVKIFFLIQNDGQCGGVHLLIDATRMSFWRMNERNSS